MTHLWEYDHPYYCAEGNYYAAPSKGLHELWPSWSAFANADNLLYDFDDDLNRLHRWDWHAWHLEFPEDYPDDDGNAERHELCLYFVLQRKAIVRSDYISVTPDDEPAIRDWLKSKAEYERSIWEPFLDADDAVTP